MRFYNADEFASQLSLLVNIHILLFLPNNYVRKKKIYLFLIMQAWQRYAKPHGFNDMRKIKAAFQKQLNKCVKQQLIRKVCEATDVDPPFVIYEFDTGNLYTFLLPVFPYLPNTSFFRFLVCYVSL